MRLGHRQLELMREMHSRELEGDDLLTVRESGPEIAVLNRLGKRGLAKVVHHHDYKGIMWRLTEDGRIEFEEHEMMIDQQ